jgi:outer membrane protein OmpA-like peptidoglycan-associated protein
MRTEDHPLARRLFLYSNPAKGNRFRNAFLFFATSDEGQALIAWHLVNLEAMLSDRATTQKRLDTIGNQRITRRSIRARLLDVIGGARRLSTTFRFRFDSVDLRLDQSAARDLANLIRFTEKEDIAADRLMILGFADSDGKIDYNLALSAERAEAIAKRLNTYGVPVPAENVLGFGEEAPVACNVRPNGTADYFGKSRNRRVEVWLRDESF